MKLSAVTLALLMMCGSAHPAERELGFEAAISLFQKGQYAESREALEKLTENGGNALVWFNLGNALFMLGEHEGAVEAYQRVVTMGSPLSAAARLYSAKAYRASGDYTRAVATLRGLRSAYPSPPPAMRSAIERMLLECHDEALDKGLEAYRGGDFDRAKRLFWAAVDAKNDAQANMALGMARIRLEDYENARRSLEAALAAAPPMAVRERIQDLIKTLEGEESGSEGLVWLDLEAAAGYDSNIFSVGSSEGPVGKPMSRVSPDAGVRIIQGKPFSMTAIYTFLWEEYASTPSLRFVSNGVALHPAYDRSNWWLELAPTYKYQTLGGLMFVSQIGATATVQKSIRKLDLGGNGTFEWNAAGSNYSYMHGNTYGAKAYARFHGGSFKAKLGYDYSKNRIGDLASNGTVLPLAGDSQGPGFELMVRLNDEYQIDSEGWYSMIHFTNSALPDGVPRDDKQMGASLKITRLLRENLGVYLSSKGILNNSTLGSGNSSDMNYHEVISLVGVKWSVL